MNLNDVWDEESTEEVNRDSEKHLDNLFKATMLAD